MNTAAVTSANRELVAAAFAALNDGDVERLLDLSTADVVALPARSGVEGAYTGHAGLLRFLADNRESFELFRVRFDELHEVGEVIVAIGTVTVRGRGGGVETEVPMAGIFGFREGRISRWEDFRERDAAFAAAAVRDSPDAAR